MAPRLIWSSYNASNQSDNSNEQCIQFFQHVQSFQVFMKVNAQKIMLKQRFYEIVNSLKQLIKKLNAQSNLDRFEKRVLNIFDQNHRDLIKIIIKAEFMTALDSQQAQSTMMTSFSTNDLNLVIKNLDKNVMKRLKNKLSITIVIEINETILQCFEIFKNFFAISNQSKKQWKWKIIIYKYFRNDDALFFVDSENDAKTLR